MLHTAKATSCEWPDNKNRSAPPPADLSPAPLISKVRRGASNQKDRDMNRIDYAYAAISGIAAFFVIVAFLSIGMEMDRIIYEVMR